jgi:hypothetical protein
MSKQEILESLDQLKRAVETLNVEQAADKKRLHRLIRDLERQVDAPGPIDHTGMAEQVDRTLKQLEVEYPSITGILNGIATTLSNYGI